MHKTLALTGLVVLTALAGCGPKKPETQNAAAKATAAPAPAANAVNAPAPQPVAAGPALPSLSPEACAVLATYVKVEMKGDFGLPVSLRIDPEKQKPGAGEAASKELQSLKPSQAKALENGLAKSMADGSQLDCDWRALGLEPPRPQTGESNAWIRFRPVISGDVADLDIFTDGVTKLGSRCLYRKIGAAWTRQVCVVTQLG